MAVATNWFDSHSFFTGLNGVFIFTPSASLVPLKQRDSFIIFPKLLPCFRGGALRAEGSYFTKL